MLRAAVPRAVPRAVRARAGGPASARAAAAVLPAAALPLHRVRGRGRELAEDLRQLVRAAGLRGGRRLGGHGRGAARRCVVVSTSKGESFGSLNAEASVLGKVVVGFNLSGAQEAVVLVPSWSMLP